MEIATELARNSEETQEYSKSATFKELSVLAQVLSQPAVGFIFFCGGKGDIKATPPLICRDEQSLD